MAEHAAVRGVRTATSGRLEMGVGDERRVRGDLAKRDERRVRGDLAKSDV